MKRDNPIKITYTPTETHKTLYRKINALRDTGKSYAEIGKILFPNMANSPSKVIVWRAHKHNDWPMDNDIRMMMKLPRFMNVYETMVRKTKPRTNRTPRNRRAINLDDPFSAAKTIVNAGVSEQYLDELSDLLRGIDLTCTG